MKTHSLAALTLEKKRPVSHFQESVRSRTGLDVVGREQFLVVPGILSWNMEQDGSLVIFCIMMQLTGNLLEFRPLVPTHRR